jgi:16S rRNA (guanine527-N7)-methyltransferase
LVNSFRKINIDLSDKQIHQFIKYYELLIEKNKVMNLTAITKYEDVVAKHFVDSILANSVMNFKKVKNIIDVGTGAGFPGIPIKILYPNINITLLDSLNKRINFLKDVVSELGLENVICVHGRAEEFGHNDIYREKYDLCVSRAVANLSTLSEYCLPFIKVGGSFVSYKASNISDEVKAATNAIVKLGGKIVNTYTINLPLEDGIERNFVIIEKVNSMNKKYPRKSGTPSREPLT